MPDIRALIVDDEPLARRGVRQLLAPFTDITVVGEGRDGRDALAALAALEPDLVFLDIQMPELDGLSVVRARGVERMPLTVFVTAHDEYAVRAFEAEALDYLVKPLTEGRFRATIARVRERLAESGAGARAERLAALLRRYEARGPRPAAALVVRTATGEMVLAEEEILWIEARDYQAGIHTRVGEFRVRESLAALEARLAGAGFIRVHRSAIVRVDQVRAWRRGAEGGDLLVLRDGTELPVSRRRLAALREQIRPDS